MAVSRGATTQAVIKSVKVDDSDCLIIFETPGLVGLDFVNIMHVPNKHPLVAMCCEYVGEPVDIMITPRRNGPDKGDK